MAQALLERPLLRIDGICAEQRVRQRLVALANPSQCGFRILQKRLRVAAVRRIARQAALYGDRHRALADHEGMAEHGCRRVARRIRQAAVLAKDCDEGAPAEVGYGAIIAEAALEALGNSLEEAVADVPSMSIVDVAQTLDVENDDGWNTVLGRIAAQQCRQMLAEEFPPGQPGQGVQRRKPAGRAVIRKRLE